MVAADDGVMPQTIEAIKHAKAAEVPILVAINKIDKPGAKPERVKQQLTEYELVPEEWGGTTIMVPVSARTKQGLPELLEYIALQAEVLELKANPEKLAAGVRRRGQAGEGARPGRHRAGRRRARCGSATPSSPAPTTASVRAMMNERGEQVKEVGPGYPVEVLGLSGVPTAGDDFNVVAGREGRQGGRRAPRREGRAPRSWPRHSKATLEDLFAKARRAARRS